MFDKKGVSHVEAVISFVIFIGFLIFAFFFFSPFRGSRTLDSTLDYAYREIKGFSEMDVQSYSVVSNSITGPVEIQIANDISYPNVSVENSNGDIVGSGVVLDTKRVRFSMPPNKFTKIKYGADYKQNPPLTSPLLHVFAIGEYTVSSSEEKKIYSIKRAVNLSEEYKLYYLDLKTKFNLPNRVDFGFSFILANKSVILAENAIPQNAEVKAKNERIELTLLDGEEQFADLIVKVW